MPRQEKNAQAVGTATVQKTNLNFPGGNPMQVQTLSFTTRISTGIAELLHGRWRPRWFRFALPAICIAGSIVCAAATSNGQTAAAPNGDGWVVLPVSEYAALRHAAFPAEAESPPPAVEATLS